MERCLDSTLFASELCEPPSSHIHMPPRFQNISFGSSITVMNTQLLTFFWIFELRVTYSNRCFEMNKYFRFEDNNSSPLQPSFTSLQFKVTYRESL